MGLCSTREVLQQGKHLLLKHEDQDSDPQDLYESPVGMAAALYSQCMVGKTDSQTSLNLADSRFSRDPAPVYKVRSDQDTQHQLKASTYVLPHVSTHM